VERKRFKQTKNRPRIIRRNYNKVIEACKKIPAVKNLIELQTSAEPLASACVAGGFENQVNGVRANIVLSLATLKPMPEIKFGYERYFQLKSSDEGQYGSIPCPSSETVSEFSLYKFVTGISTHPTLLSYSGRADYLRMIKLAKLNLSEKWCNLFHYKDRIYCFRDLCSNIIVKLH